MTTNVDKNLIKTKLSEYVARYASQNAAANSLRNVSPSTISQIMNDKWDKIADEMWRNIAAQVGIKNWEMAETRCFKLITETMQDAQIYANAHAVTAAPGSGKSFTARHYAQTHKNVYHITCCEWWLPRAFFSELLRVMGLEYKVVNNDNSSMIGIIVDALKKKETPLIILDEADKLNNKVFCGIITLYNQLEDYCGMVLMATDNLELKINMGIRRGFRGFNEVYSRVGRRIINLNANGPEDIAKVCRANGVTAQFQIDKVTGDCDFDLRRVKRFIHSVKVMEQRDGTGN